MPHLVNGPWLVTGRPRFTSRIQIVEAWATEQIIANKEFIQFPTFPIF